MALFMNQNGNRTKLQERLEAELHDKAKKRAELENTERPDGVDDSNYLKQTKTTSSRAWVWLLIAAAVIATIIVLLIVG